MANRIKELRKKSDLTLLQLSELLGVSESTVQRYESGNIKNLKYETITQLSEILNASPGYIMGWEESNGMPAFSNVVPLSTQSLPILGKIACGTPKFMDEDRVFYTREGANIKADFILIASGDSMINARINDGDLVFIRQQPTVDNGEIAAVAIGDEATLKRIYYYQEKSLMILKSENPKYEDMIYSGEELEDVRILGKAIAFQSDII